MGETVKLIPITCIKKNVVQDERVMDPLYG